MVSYVSLYFYIYSNHVVYYELNCICRIDSHVRIVFPPISYKNEKKNAREGIRRGSSFGLLLRTSTLINVYILGNVYEKKRVHV